MAAKSTKERTDDSSSSNTMIDIKSPYYLHPYDHPGLLFVTQILNEGGDNYFTWRSSFLNGLRSKNKVGFVDGTLAKPDVNSTNLQNWIQCNAIVKSWLINAISKELQTAATHTDTASEIWGDFEERFTQGITLRVYELKRAIALLQQEKDTISTYYGKLKNVWGELKNLRPTPTCTCGAGRKMEEMREEEKVFDFLMGLDDAYATVRSQILSIEPFPGIRRAYALAAQDEKQLSVAATLPAKTQVSQEHGAQRQGGDSCHTLLHCTHCNRTNHTKENCFQFNGYPPQWKKRKGRGERQRNMNNQGAGTLGFAATSDTTTTSTSTPTFTAAQVQHLIELLGNQSEAPIEEADWSG